MFLNYLALVMILIVLVMLYYVFIYIHELPYEAAKHRHHPHTDAIYVACWLSLFTLHAIWPLVFIWALMHKHPAEQEPVAEAETTGLSRRLSQFENRLQLLEERHSQPTNGAGTT